MEKVLFEFGGHNKVTLPLLYHDNYDYNVQVFQDHIVIKRIGVLRQGLQEQTILYFDDVKDITYDKFSGNTWIKFIVPGMQQSGGGMVVTSKVTNKFSVADVVDNSNDIPYDNSYAIINYKDKNETLKQYFNQISEIFHAYKQEVRKLEKSNNIINDESALDKLKKLKDLYDSGVLSEQEYEEKRKKLLELI